MKGSLESFSAVVSMRATTVVALLEKRRVRSLRDIEEVLNLVESGDYSDTLNTVNYNMHYN